MFASGAPGGARPPQVGQVSSSSTCARRAGVDRSSGGTVWIRRPRNVDEPSSGRGRGEGPPGPPFTLATPGSPRIRPCAGVLFFGGTSPMRRPGGRHARDPTRGSGRRPERAAEAPVRRVEERALPVEGCDDAAFFRCPFPYLPAGQGALTRHSYGVRAPPGTPPSHARAARAVVLYVALAPAGGCSAYTVRLRGPVVDPATHGRGRPLLSHGFPRPFVAAAPLAPGPSASAFSACLLPARPWRPRRPPAARTTPGTDDPLLIETRRRCLRWIP